MPDLSIFPQMHQQHLRNLWNKDRDHFWRFYNELLRSKNISVQNEEKRGSISHDKAPPNEGSRVDIRAQKGLLELNPPQKPQWELFAEQSQSRALELVRVFKLPIKAFEVMQTARVVAGKHTFDLPSLKPFLEALLQTHNLQAEGLTRDVALLLLHLACWVGLKRGYHPITGEVSFHIPQTLLGAYLWPGKQAETQRKSLKRALDKLAAQGFVSYLGRMGNAKKYEVLPDGTKKEVGWMPDGTVFNVRLRPGRIRPLNRDDLALEDWRDLDGDIRSGRTVNRLLSSKMSHSEKTVEGLVSEEEIKEWALPPVLKASSSLTEWDIHPDRVHALLRNVVQDVKFSTNSTRMQFIGAAAGAISKNLMDEHSRWMYFKLLGGARVLLERGVNRFDQLQAHIGQVLYEYGAGQAHKPGAVLITRLKESGLWDELSRAWESCTWKHKAPPDDLPPGVE